MICSNITVNDEAHLCFAGRDVTELAKKYSTPLYLYDERLIRENCRMYKRAMAEHFGGGSRPAYAGKAACFKYMYEIMAQEDMNVDLVSSGEIYTALKAGFPMERAFFHGNNKTDADIAFAIDCGVGHFVVDGFDELHALNRIAGEKGVVQKVLLRITPGIDPHTYEAINTGKVDSKFGVAIETGQAAAFAAEALVLANISVRGIHCHVGSLVFDEENSVYQDTAEIMLTFLNEVNKKHSAKLDIFNIGGGYATRYVNSDPSIDIPRNIENLARFIKNFCTKLGMDMPTVLMEPGRSIVADAGMTLYSVGTIKKIPGYKNYVSVDGGMTDNPRYALYGSEYTVYNAGRMRSDDMLRCDLVGRCCESGDIIQPDVELAAPQRGDIIAVCTTGAYNYSMASNYNRVGKPAVLMLDGDSERIAVRRETLDDILSCDM